jgi:ABC-2 type transport system permease protein
LGAAARIAIKDLRLRVRDRSAFILGLIAPLMLAFIFNTVLGGAVDGGGLSLGYGIVDLDRSEISDAFTSVLTAAESEEILTVETFPDRVSATEAVEEGDIDAFIVVPEGFSQAVFANRSSTVEVVGDIDSPTSTQIAAAIAEQFSSGLAASQAAVGATAALVGELVTDEFVASLSQDPATAGNTFAFTDRSARARQLDESTFFAAGMAVFFLFFTVQFGVVGILEEEREGTLPRLMAAPIPRVAVVAGKAILAFLLGVISMAVLVISTSLLMGADWGAPLGVTLLVVAGVLSAVGIMGLIAAFAQTPEGAGNLGAIIAVILGMLGGTFFPVGSTGGVLSALTYLTPHAWFLRGLADLSGGEASWTAALPSVGAILGFAVIASSVAWMQMRRRWVR